MGSGVRPEKSNAQKMRENLDYMRARPGEFTREDIDNEIQIWKAKLDEESKNERKLSGLEKVAATGSQIASGATFGFFDELSGDKDTQRYLQEQMREEHPVASFGAEVLGGLAVPGSALKVAKNASRLKKAATVLGEGAIQGGLSGMGNANGSLEDRVRGTGSGMAAGSVAAGALAGVGRGIGAVRKAAAVKRGVHTPSLEELVSGMPAEAIDKAKARYGEIAKRGLGNEAKVADVLPDGEGLLRSQRTANKDVAKTIDADLRGRSTRLANVADERLSRHTGATPKSATKTLDELLASAKAKGEPHYAAGRQEAKAWDAANPRPSKPTPDPMAESGARNIDLGPSDSDTARIMDDQSRGRGLTADEQFEYDYAEGKISELDMDRGKMWNAYRRFLRDNPRKPGDDNTPSFDEYLVDEFGAGPEVERILGRKPQGRFGPERPDAPELAPARNPRGLLDEALELPFVRREIGRLKADPREAFKGVADDDHNLLARVYQNLGADIRDPKLSRADKRDFVSQREKLRAAIGQRSPAWLKGNEEFAGEMALKDAYESGVTRNTPADMIPQELSELSPSEAKMFKEGKAQTLRANVPNADLGEFARFSDVLAPVANREKAEVFKATFGEDAYREYLGDLLEMAKMQKLRAGAGESTTVDKLLEQFQVSNPDLMDMIAGMATGGMSPRGVASKALSMVGVDKLLSSKKNAAENASMLLRSGDDVPKTLDEMVRMRSLAETPRHPLLFKNDNRPTLDQVKNTAAREVGAVVGRRKRAQ